MSDFNKIFGGKVVFDKAMSKSNEISSIMALSGSFMLTPKWFQQHKDYLPSTVGGSALDLWKSLVNSPKNMNGNELPSFLNFNGPFDFHKSNLNTTNSLSYLSGSINWSNFAKNHSNMIRPNDFSLNFFPSNISEILSKSYFKNIYGKSNNIWANNFSTLIEQNSVEKNFSETNEIERFAQNVAILYSEIESFDENQRNKFATNINDVLNYEVKTTDEFSFPLILDLILSKYNEAIESAFFSNNIAELNNIYSKLKAITFVGWIGIILTTSAFGIIENQAGNLFEKFTGTNNVTPQFNIIFNAQTNSSRPLRIEPDGRSKIICEVPDCTDVQLGEIVNKYVQVTFLNNGSLTIGWCINKEFVIKD